MNPSSVLAGRREGVSLLSHTLLVSLFCGIVIAGTSGAPRAQTTVWSRAINSLNYDEVRSVSVNSSGVFVAGTTAAATLQRIRGDAIVRRYDFDGHLIWEERYDFTNQEYALGVDVYEGGVYTVGFSWANGGGVATSFVGRRDLDGNVTWTKRFAGSYGAIVHDVVVDATGIYVDGMWNNASFIPVSGFLRHYDFDGNLLWDKPVSIAAWYSYPTLGGMELDATGIFVTGGNNVSGSSNEFGFLKKFDHNGNELWSITDTAYRSDVTRWGTTLYVCGRGHDRNNFAEFGVVEKRGLDGSLLWQRRIPAPAGVTSRIELFGIAADNGGVYVTGASDLGGVNQSDAIFKRYSPHGTLVWSAGVSTPTYDFGFGIDVDDGGVYVTGIQATNIPTPGTGAAFIKRLEKGEFVTANLDVRPGSCENPLNTMKVAGDRGPAGIGAVLPVALLGSSVFDVRDVDLTTVLLEGVSPTRSNFVDVSGLPADDEGCPCPSDGQDGFDDLAMKFSATDIALALEDAAAAPTRTVVLSGKLASGTLFEAVDCVQFVGNPIGEPGNPQEAPEAVLGPATPNPFNPQTSIAYTLPRDAHVRLTIYDAAGRRVEQLLDENVSAGRHVVQWNAAGRASGIYFYRIDYDNHSETGKMVLLK